MPDEKQGKEIPEQRELEESLAPSTGIWRPSMTPQTHGANRHCDCPEPDDHNRHCDDL